MDCYCEDLKDAIVSAIYIIVNFSLVIQTLIKQFYSKDDKDKF